MAANSTIGSGFLVDAFGKHAVGGAVVETRVEANATTGEKDVFFHVLLGPGEWDAIELLTYDGVVLSDFTFHPGIASPPQDSRFPNSLRHGRIARYTVKLPNGITTDADPSKLVAICRCLKMPIYNSDGSVFSASSYTTNPSDQFNELIRRNCAKLGLTLNDHIDFVANQAARNYYNTNITHADYNKVPRNFKAQMAAGGGSLATGDYLVSVQAVGSTPATDYSLRAGETLVTIASAGQKIDASCDTVTDAVNYRWWWKEPGGTYRFFDTGTPAISITGGGTVGTPPTGAGGIFSTTRPRFESNVFFDGPTNLQTALNTIMWQCASDWTRDGKKYRILTPEARTPVFSLSPANTMPGSFKFWRTSRDTRPNRVTLTGFRDYHTDLLTPAEPVTVNREDIQAKVHIIEEEVPVFTMSLNQAFRIANERIRKIHDLSERGTATEDGTGPKILVGDVGTFTDAAANWSSKEFLVVSREIGDSDGAGNVTLELWEYGVTYADNDSKPLQSTQPQTIPDRFSAPPAISALTLTQTSELKDEGTVLLGAKGDVTFAGYTGEGRQRGLVSHKKPGAGSFDYLFTIEPDPATGHGGFRAEGLTAGLHKFKVVTVSGIGIEQTASVVEYSLNVVVYAVLPPAPTAGVTPFRDNDIIKWNWTKSTAPNVSYYLIKDLDNNILARTDTAHWDEAVPDTSTVQRKVFAVDTNGNVSSSHLALTYNADYADNRVVFNGPVGSGNFVEAGDTTSLFVEAPEILKFTGGDLDTESRIFTKSTADAWDSGLMLSRAFAFGDCEFSYEIPYATNSADAVILGFSTNVIASGLTEHAVPTDYNSYRWGIFPRSTVYNGGGSSDFRVFEFGSIVSTIANAWAPGDLVKIKVESGSVKFYKNNTLLYTSANAARYPLVPLLNVWNQGQTVDESKFALAGTFENTQGAKAHWKNVVNAVLNFFDSLSPTATSGAGGYSVEYYSGSFFLEFDFTSNTSGDTAYTVGFSTVDADANRDSIEYGIEISTPTASGLANKAYRVYESGSLVHTTQDAALTLNDRFRVAFENGVVKYYRNGALFFTSSGTPDTTKRWHVDSNIDGEISGGGIRNLFMGSIGTTGEGWRIKPNGLAELAKGVTIGGAPIDAVKARAINAIGLDNRYRGNDYGAPLANRLDASMFKLGNIRTVEDDIIDELFINIPDSVLLDTYANFDSTKLARVKVHNLFGQVVTEVEVAFTGRGKVVIGVHSRDYADPVEQAVYAVQIRNAYGWSTPVYWADPTSNWTVFGITWNGTTTPPAWRSVLQHPTNLSAQAISPSSIQLNWTAPVTISGNQSSYCRPLQKKTARAGFNTADSAIGSSATSGTITGLSPNTDYEVTVRGDASGERSNYVYVRTPSAFAAGARAAPSGLSAVPTSTTAVSLMWTRNATDNDNVEVYKDGSLLSTESASTVTKSVTSLTAGTTYRFQVRNKWSSGTTYSDWSNEVQITVPTDPLPTANDPTSLTAILEGNGNQVKLDWNRNGGSNGRVERSFDGITYSTIVSSLGTTQTYTDIPGYNKHVWYKVFNATSGSNYSNVIDLFTSAAPDPDPVCVTPDTPILVSTENGPCWKEARLIGFRDLLVNKLNRTSVVTAVRRGLTSRLYVITTENGKQLWCSPSHPIIQSVKDDKGKPAHLYKVGDSVLTYHEGEIVQSTVAAIEIIETPHKASVLIFQLLGEHSFVSAGIVSHNLKQSGL